MKRRICLFVVWLLLSLTVSIPIARAAEFSTFSDLNGKTIAMLAGAAPLEKLINSKVPEVGEFQYFATVPDMELALRSGKIDAFLLNSAISTLLSNKNKDLTVFPENLGEAPFGFAFAKGSPERDEWQKAFDSIGKDEVQRTWEKWTGADDSVKTIPEQDWPGKNGEVRVASCDTMEPVAYAGEDGQLIGFDIDIILQIAKKLDKHVTFTGMDFSAVMPEVQSGKSDIACGSILITKERSETFDFVEYYPGASQLMIREEAVETGDEGFFQGLLNSFDRTFIRDSRFKTVLAGLGLTIAMSLFAGFFGYLIGFGLVFLRRKNKLVFNGFIHGYSAIVMGVPAVVILLVLYYIVFGAIDLPAVLVAGIGFSLISGVRIYTSVWSAVAAVDIGQQEAGYALGYPDGLAFRRIILPQARQVYMPLIRTQFVMLVKETSIAGYITVVDLTRAGDLIRSRTMEAFFPLIAIAIIYFLLTWLLGKAIDVFNRRLTAKSRNRKIKGVD